MVRRGWRIALSLLVGLFASVFLNIGSISAQGGAVLAFMNGSGQLIVSSGDGSYRWIVTNPGEPLHGTLGYTWSPDGGRLFFAVGGGGSASLRVGDLNTQSVIEIGQASGSLSGGQWLPNGSGVLVADGSAVNLYAADGGGTQPLVNAGGAAIVSPFANDRPYLQSGSSISPDGRYLFFWQGDGRYVVSAIDGSGTSFTLPGTNDAGARASGLWSNTAPLVAYWGYEGSATLSVTDASNGQTVTLNSGRTAPITPLAWLPGTTYLVYRDATSFVRLTDLACLSGGCGSNPLESGAELMPGSASDVQIEGAWGYYLDGEQVKAVNMNCVSSGGCMQNALVLGANAAPQTPMDVRGTLLSYTAYSADPYNGADRETRVVDLRCLDGGGCGAQTAATGSVSGLVSADGSYVIVEGVGGGLNTLRPFDGAVTFLSDGAGLLNWARWR